MAENLSTFSAFVKQIREVLESAGERSLVLLDELGAGTDPDEGAALAQAILETLAERGALVIATTHLEPLRAFAATHPRARNASVEFDTATLAPTFRLRYGHPGRSYALAIAGRLGLAPELIARAEAHRSKDAARMSELLSRLDEHTRCEAERTIAMDRRESETAARLAAAREAETAAERKAQTIVARATAEATALLAEVRRALAAEWDRLKRAERSRRSLEESRQRVREVAARVEAVAAPAGPSTDAPGDLTLGTTVAAEHLGIRGELLAIALTEAAYRRALPVSVINHLRRVERRLAAACILEWLTYAALPCSFWNRVTGKQIWMQRAHDFARRAMAYRISTLEGDAWQADEPGVYSPDFMCGAAGTGQRAAASRRTS